MQKPTGASSIGDPEYQSYPGHNTRILEFRPFGGVVVLHICEDLKKAYEESTLRGDVGPLAEAFTWLSSARLDTHIFYPKDTGVGTIAHESLHAVTDQLGKAGITFSDATEEVWAYHLQSICDDTIGFFNEIKKQVLTKKKPSRRVGKSAAKK